MPPTQNTAAGIAERREVSPGELRGRRLFAAILRYRLYDIDIINRALVYGPLTVSLAAVYFAGVVGPRPPCGPVPARSSSPW